MRTIRFDRTLKTSEPQATNHAFGDRTTPLEDNHTPLFDQFGF